VFLKFFKILWNGRLLLVYLAKFEIDTL